LKNNNSQVKLGRDELFREVKQLSKNATFNLTWGLVFFCCFLLIVDLLINASVIVELFAIKLVFIVLVLSSLALLKSVNVKPNLINHVVLPSFLFSILLSYSIVSFNGKIIYTVIIAMVMVFYNIIAIWKVSDAVFQYLIMCLIILLFIQLDYIELDFFLKNGGYTVLTITAVSIALPAVKVLNIKDDIVEDLTQRNSVDQLNIDNRKLERELSSMQHKLTSVQDHIKVLKHDLKNKLSSISALVDLLQSGDQKLLPEQEEYLNYITKSVDELSSLSANLSDPFETVVKNSNTDHYIDIDLSQNLIQNKNRFINQIDSKNINFDFDFGDLTPMIFVDENLFNIAIQNIYKYAIRFSSNNDVVKIAVTKQKGSIKITIYNTSTGISMVELESYFKNISNYKLKEINETQGLGLSISKTNIEQIGGYFKYSSSESLGFEFVLEFEDHN
jgi:signal transduction histidine kinase